jgi:hypothetical protein
MFDFRLPIFDFYSLQLGLFAGGVTLVEWNVVEDEDESTRAGGCGQFPKFGAMRKNRRLIFVQAAQSRKLLREFDSSMWSAVLLAVPKREEEPMDADRDYFHSRCTGNAERQLPVLGSRFSVKFKTSPRISRIITKQTEFS